MSTKKKPDRWERLVEKYEREPLNPYKPYALIVESCDVVRLLSREHQAVLRLVRELARIKGPHYSHTPECAGYRLACRDVLSELKRRAK